MFRRFGFIMAAALIAAPAAAQSQAVSVSATGADERPVKLTIGGGFTGVYGGASDRIGNGGNFTLGVLFRTNKAIALHAEYAWNGMEQRNIKIPVSPTINPLATSSVDTDFFADANMQYGSLNMLFGPRVTGKTAPYGITGLGVYYRPVAITTPAVGFATVCDPYWYVCYPTAVPVEQVVGSRSSTDFGMNFGGGINFQVKDNFSIFFEIRYHYIWGPTLDQANLPTQLPAGVTTTDVTRSANGQFMPITLGFRF